MIGQPPRANKSDWSLSRRSWGRNAWQAIVSRGAHHLLLTMDKPKNICMGVDYFQLHLETHSTYTCSNQVGVGEQFIYQPYGCKYAPLGRVGHLTFFCTRIFFLETCVWMVFLLCNMEPFFQLNEGFAFLAEFMVSYAGACMCQRLQFSGRSVRNSNLMLKARGSVKQDAS